MHDSRLLAPEVVQPLLGSQELAIFKPICDSHYGDEILRIYPGSKVLWFYRRFRDVVNSSLRMWPGHSREILDRFRAGDLGWLGWRGERLAPAQLAELHSLWRPDLTDHEAGAIFWYLRNSFYFSTGLVDRRDCCMLLAYEDLVADPCREFGRVFDFLGLAFSENMVSEVSARSVGKEDFPCIDPRIEALCDGLQARLDAALLR